jgi:hypothetical protein
MANLKRGSTVAQEVSRWNSTFSTRVQAQIMLGRIYGTKAGFSEYFCFPCHLFYQLSHINHHLPSGTGTMGPVVDSVSPIPREY